MSECCGEKALITSGYVPLNERLLAFGEEVYGADRMKEMKNTSLWVFSFFRQNDVCIECEEGFAAMSNWFDSYGFFNNPTKNVKWILEDDPDMNKICLDLHIDRYPVHFFCDKSGKIIDVYYGIPKYEWLSKYISPLLL